MSGAVILIAEDENVVAVPLASSLKEAGHQTYRVTTVHGVRESLPKLNPTLLILDTTLDTDGLEYLQAIRFAPECPPAGVIVLTPPDDIHVRERASQLGAAAVFAKPLHMPDVVAVVSDLLSVLESVS